MCKIKYWKKPNQSTLERKNEDILKDCWYNIKDTKFFITEVPEGEEREKCVESIFDEITDENYPNLKK